MLYRVVEEYPQSLVCRELTVEAPDAQTAAEDPHGNNFVAAGPYLVDEQGEAITTSVDLMPEGDLVCSLDGYSEFLSDATGAVEDFWRWRGGQRLTVPEREHLSKLLDSFFYIKKRSP